MLSRAKNSSIPARKLLEEKSSVRTQWQDELIYRRHSCPGAVSGSWINVITAVAR